MGVGEVVEVGEIVEVDEVGTLDEVGEFIEVGEVSEVSKNCIFIKVYGLSEFNEIKKVLKLVRKSFFLKTFLRYVGCSWDNLYENIMPKVRNFLVNFGKKTRVSFVHEKYFFSQIFLYVNCRRM